MQESPVDIISTPAQEFRWPLDGQRQILKLIADYLEGIDILTFADSSQSNFSGSLPICVKPAYRIKPYPAPDVPLCIPPTAKYFCVAMTKWACQGMIKSPGEN